MQRCAHAGNDLDLHGSFARQLWTELGIVKTDRIRLEFMRQTKKLGLPDLTAPKTLRHLFATTLQDANVDPLIRNELMGHSPASTIEDISLGMTATYTHTRLDTKRRQLEMAFEQNLISRIALEWRISQDPRILGGSAQRLLESTNECRHND